MKQRQHYREGKVIPGETPYCPNCDASMVEYIYAFDCLCAVLLCRMGDVVRMRLEEGLPFTQANQVRIPTLDTTHAVKCRTTIASKLGLVAKVRNEDGSQARGVWCITERGFAALRGEPVPAHVKVWRGEVEERFDDRITMAEAYQVHREAVERAIQANRTPKSDYRSDSATYNPSDWYDIGGYHEGRLL